MKGFQEESKLRGSPAQYLKEVASPPVPTPQVPAS